MIESKEKMAKIECNCPRVCDPNKCCHCLRIEVGVAFIAMCVFLDIFALWFFVYQIYYRSGLGYSIIFFVATIPQAIIAWIALRWMMDDSGYWKEKFAFGMLLNVPFKVVHGVLMMLFAEIDNNKDGNGWDYWLPGAILDVVLFSYCAWVVRQYVKRSKMPLIG